MAKITKLEVGQTYTRQDGRQTKIVRLDPWRGDGAYYSQTSTLRASNAQGFWWFADGEDVGKFGRYAKDLNDPHPSDFILPELFDPAPEQLSLFD